MKTTAAILTAIVLMLPLQARVSCKSMSSCKEACEYLESGYTSLDRDHDGIPCEKLCHKPCKAQKPKPKKSKRGR